jgi:hypothetical protein
MPQGFYETGHWSECLLVLVSLKTSHQKVDAPQNFIGTDKMTMFSIQNRFIIIKSFQY